MKIHKLRSIILAVVAFGLTASFTYGGDHTAWPADWNNWSDPALWVTVGNPSNAADTTGYGSVDHTFQIGKFEVTAGQYTAFLNTVAKIDTYGLYNINMWNDYLGYGIQRSGSSGSYTYSVASDYANRPVNFVSWGDSARFCNWMQTGTTETGAYTLNGATTVSALMTIIRNPDAKFFIPTEDEWYKAAYHKNEGVTGNYFDYPTGVDTPVPGRDMTELTNPGNNANYVGTPYPIDPPYMPTLAGEFQLSDSPYGTFDQGGNVWEWNEAVVTSSSRGYRGGSYHYNSDSLLASNRYGQDPTYEFSDIGFRVGSIPEPGSITLLICGSIAGLIWRRYPKWNPLS